MEEENNQHEQYECMDANTTFFYFIIIFFTSNDSSDYVKTLHVAIIKLAHEIKITQIYIIWFRECLLLEVVFVLFKSCCNSLEQQTSHLFFF